MQATYTVPNLFEIIKEKFRTFKAASYPSAALATHTNMWLRLLPILIT
jgi:hypothetical protein